MSLKSIPLAVLLMAAPLRLQAGENGLEGWRVPHPDATVDMVVALQKTLKVADEAGLLDQTPWLAVIPKLNPQSEAHRRIVGMLDSYRREDAEEKMSKAVSARADEIAAAVRRGHGSVAQLEELAPFATVSEQAKNVKVMLLEAHWTGTMAGAHRIAWALEQKKEASSPDHSQRAHDNGEAAAVEGRFICYGYYCEPVDAIENRLSKFKRPAAGRPLLEQPIRPMSSTPENRSPQTYGWPELKDFLQEAEAVLLGMVLPAALLAAGLLPVVALARYAAGH